MVSRLRWNSPSVLQQRGVVWKGRGEKGRWWGLTQDKQKGHGDARQNWKDGIFAYFRIVKKHGNLGMGRPALDGGPLVKFAGGY